MTLSGLEVALFRAFLLDKGRGSSSTGAPTRRASRRTSPSRSCPKRRACAWLAKVRKTAFRHYKVKVSGRVERDIRFVKAVQAELLGAGQPFLLRLDGNQGDSAASYQKMLARLEKSHVQAECFEQPLRQGRRQGCGNCRSSCRCR